MPGAAIFVLGPSGLALGRRLRALLPGARLSGPAALAGECDETYAGATAAIAAAFAAGRPVIGVCASGILIRAVAPLLADKRDEPPVVAVAEDGSAAVPLLGGHRGGNALARRIAAALGGAAAITTAGDLRLGIALDEPPPGWKLAEPAPVKRIAAALLAGEPVALCGEAPWLRAAPVAWAETARLKIVVSERAPTPDPDTLVYHPPVLAVGIGCARGCPAEEIAALAQDSLAGAGLAPAAVAAVVSVELKSDEPGIHALAAAWGVPARFFSAARLLEETPRLTERSAAAFRAAGCWGVAEGAALAAAGGPAATLVVAKRRSAGATCAVARAAAPLDAQTLGRARGRRHRPGRRRLAYPRGRSRARRRRRGRRAHAVSRPRRQRDRRQDPARLCDRRGGGARPPRPRPRRRRPAGGAGVVRRCRHLRHGGAGLRADRARPAARMGPGRARRAARDQRDAGRRRPRRRAARPRFLCGLAVRPADPMGGDPRPPRSRRRGRLRHRPLQPALGPPRRPAGRGRRHSADAARAGDAGVHRPQSRPRRRELPDRDAGRARRRGGRHAEPRHRRQFADPPRRRPALHPARLFRAMTVHFIGAGPGAPDLITLRGHRLIGECMVCLYAGSLVPRAVVAAAPPGARLVDTSALTLDEIVAEIEAADRAGHDVARVHSGDPSLYGAIAEQMRRLDRLGIAYDVTPGVPAFAAAAAALKQELTRSE